MKWDLYLGELYCVFVVQKAAVEDYYDHYLESIVTFVFTFLGIVIKIHSSTHIYLQLLYGLMNSLEIVLIIMTMKMYVFMVDIQRD